MEIIITKAMREDLSVILSLLEMLEVSSRKTLPLEHAERIFSRISQYPNYDIFVARINDEIVGCFSLLIMDNLAHGGLPSAIVEDVIVAPTWQRKGIGTRMMQCAVERSQAAKCYKLVLSSNMTREVAHCFYEKFGFKIHGYSFDLKLT